MASDSRARRRPGAVAVGDDDRKRKRGWLKWLLPLLLLLAIAIVLIALLTGGDDAKKKTAGAGGASTGSLTAGGGSLLPVPAKSKLAALKGQGARGRAVVIQSVVPGRGFWVGSSKTDRFYVEYGTGGKGQEAGAAGFPSKVGEHVNLTGVVQPAPKNAASFLKIPSADAAQIQQQGAFINANPHSVKKVG